MPLSSNLRAIDRDVHPAVPAVAALMAYLDDHWRDPVVERDIRSLETISYPPRAPITARPDCRAADGHAAAGLADVERHVFARWRADLAILNCLCGVQLVFNEDMAQAFARAVNDWIVTEWLDRDAR